MRVLPTRPLSASSRGVQSNLAPFAFSCSGGKSRARYQYHGVTRRPKRVKSIIPKNTWPCCAFFWRLKYDIIQTYTFGDADHAIAGSEFSVLSHAGPPKSVLTSIPAVTLRRHKAEDLALRLLTGFVFPAVRQAHRRETGNCRILPQARRAR